MNRKLLVLLIAFTPALATSVATFADDASPTTQGAGDERPGGERRGQALERFKSALAQLDLSDQQKTQVKSILTEARAKLEAVKGEANARSQARPIIQQALKDIMGVLNDTQKAKLKEILKSDRAEAKN